jgi:predicted DNA-binding transcriptional regulator AlpA
MSNSATSTNHKAENLLMLPAVRKGSPEPHPLAAGGVNLDPEAAAAFLGCSVWTLAAYRCKGTGPRFFKLGNRVRYAPAALAEWIESRTVASTSEYCMKKVG